MDLEKAYNRVYREGLWECLRMYGIVGRLLEAVKSFYRGSTAKVRVWVAGWKKNSPNVSQACRKRRLIGRGGGCSCEPIG